MTHNTILSDLPAIEDELLALRLQVDKQLAPQFPSFKGKPYPLGRCREIRDAVFDLLKQTVTSPKSIGMYAIYQYLKDGGQIKKIWGDLRGDYFQNALIMDDLYVDVANDTVDINKAKIEVLPFVKSGMREISDYSHFARVARKYWNAEVFANTVFPEMAPILPLILHYQTGDIALGVANDYMISLTQQSQFQFSHDAINSFPVVSDSLRQRFIHQTQVDQNPLLSQGKDAIDVINSARKSKKFLDQDFRNQVVKTWTTMRCKRG